MRLRSLIVASGAVVALAGFTVPAFADAYAFGFSGNDGNETLTLGFAGGGTATINTNGFQGWFSPNGSNTAGPAGNPNYVAGSFSGILANDFFVFDTAGQSGTVTSATLSVSADTISNPLTWTLHDVSTPTATLHDGVSPNAAVYADLGSGVLYGSAALTPGESGGTIAVTLDSAAVAAINGTLGGDFAIGGTVNNPVPEPMTLGLFAAGLVGLGMTRRRKTV